MKKAFSELYKYAFSMSCFAIVVSYYPFVLFRLLYLDYDSIIAITLNESVAEFLSHYIDLSYKLILYWMIIYLLLPLVLLFIFVQYWPRYALIPTIALLSFAIYIWICSEGYSGIVDLGLFKIEVWHPTPSNWQMLCSEVSMMKSEIASMNRVKLFFIVSFFSVLFVAAVRLYFKLS